MPKAKSVSSPIPTNFSPESEVTDTFFKNEILTPVSPPFNTPSTQNSFVPSTQSVTQSEVEEWVSSVLSELEEMSVMDLYDIASDLVQGIGEGKNTEELMRRIRNNISDRSGVTRNLNAQFDDES